MDVVVKLNLAHVFSLCFCLLNGEFYVQLVQGSNFVVDILHHILCQLVAAHSHSEVVVGSTQNFGQEGFDVVVKVVHAEVEVLELGILDGHPHLDCLARL